MPRRLSEKEKKEIRRLQESGLSDAEISRILNIPPYIIRYQRPEVKEKYREYYQKSEVKEKYAKEHQSPEERELSFVIEAKKNNNLEEILKEIDVQNNPYFHIIYGIGRYEPILGKRISKKIKVKATGRMAALRRMGIVEKDEFNRYSLTQLGKEIYNALRNMRFEPVCYFRNWKYNKIFIKK